ncbi:MAG TPA: hypothetical protein VM677_02100 [Actinokineospora sp.]|nr:hypothetical protein [Actinokineospora sp.]
MAAPSHIMAPPVVAQPAPRPRTSSIEHSACAGMPTNWSVVRPTSSVHHRSRTGAMSA